MTVGHTFKLQNSWRPLWPQIPKMGFFGSLLSGFFFTYLLLHVLGHVDLFDPPVLREVGLQQGEASLTLDAQELWALDEQLRHFADIVDSWSHPNSGLWYEIQPASSRLFFANSQPSKCIEKLEIFMYDNGWNTQFTEFDIVEEGDVPLLMSLPQIKWETLDSNSNLLQRRLICPVHWHEKNGLEDSH